MSDRTHRTRLARALAALTDTTYQAALTRVTRAADAGQLPDLLDQHGMRRALDILWTPDPGKPVGAAALQPRYYRLAEIGLQPPAGVEQRIARARALGVAPVDLRDSYDPVDVLDDTMDLDDPDRGSDWWARIVAGGRRDDGQLPSPYPPGSTPDGYLPIDGALGRRDATGDIHAYERELRAIIRREPRDIDAYAHLGHLYLHMADGTVEQPPPDKRQRKTWYRTALGHYYTAVGVAELALPEPFTGLLRWAGLDNRPFFRALHGTALALWRMQRYQHAEQVLLNMLWLNPDDNQGARDVLTDVRACRPWTAGMA